MNALRHLRVAARSLGRAPGFSFAVIATLTVVLGPGVALLSLVEQLYFRPLPIERPAELVVFDPPRGPFSGSSSVQSGFSMPMSYPEYETFAAWQDSPFAGVACRVPVALSLAFDGTADQIVGELVSGNYFDLLGVRAEHGRLLTAEDDRVIGGHPVAVLSWGAWQRRFGGDPGIVGRQVTVNGQSFAVLGVAARGFRSLELEFAPELWLPMKMKPVATPLRSDLDNPRSRWLNIVARLGPGVDLEAAELRANEIYRRSSAAILETYPPPRRISARASSPATSSSSPRVAADRTCAAPSRPPCSPCCRWSACCSSSPAPTWRTSSSPAPPATNATSRCDWRSAPAGATW